MVLKKSAFVFLTILMVVSCVPRAKYNKILMQRDSLVVAGDSQTFQMETLQSYIDEISSCLDSIAFQESVLFLPDPEINNRPLSKDEKIKRLENFQELVERQHKRIGELELIVSKDSIELSKFRSIIVYLSNEIEEKNQSITKLKAELSNTQKQVKSLNGKIENLNSHISALNSDIENLESISQEQMQALSIQDELLNKAFVCIGTKRELYKTGVVTGLNKLHLDKINTENCSEVDIRTFLEVSIEARNVKLLSQHTSSSYALKKNSDMTYTLSIISPADFWSFSPYLVIMTY